MGSVPELARQVLGTGFSVDVQADGEDLETHLRRVRGVHAVDTVAPGHYRLLAEDDVRADAARAVVQAGGELHRRSVDLASLDAIYNRYFHDTDAGAREERHTKPSRPALARDWRGPAERRDRAKGGVGTWVLARE